MFNIDVDKLLMINIAVAAILFSCYNKFFDCFT